MKKTLIIVAHPNLDNSKVNKRWIEEIKKYPNKFTIHNLYETYPNWDIDIEKEQKLIEKHGSIVLQFPIYWFNCTPLLKKWLDDVWTDGWAYGKSGTKLENRNIGLAITAGINRQNYSRYGDYKYTLEEILVPFEITINYCKGIYKKFVAFYSAEFEATKERIEESVEKYINYVNSI